MMPREVFLWWPTTVYDFRRKQLVVRWLTKAWRNSDGHHWINH